MALPQKFIEKAKNELNETEVVREKCLQDLREWLFRHDYFVECRKGETTLKAISVSPELLVIQHLRNFTFDVNVCR